MSEPFFLTWEDEQGKARVLESSGRALAQGRTVVRSSTLYQDYVRPGTSIRDNLKRSDFNDVRPEDTLPTTVEGRMEAAFDAYDNFGVVRNIIDMMSDFVTQGIDLVHTRPSTEAFYKKWFKLVNGKERSERFAHLLYLPGNIVVRRMTATIPVQLERDMRTTGADIPLPAPTEVARREIPWRYVFSHPLSLKILGGDLAPFIGKEAIRFAIQIPRQILQRLKKVTGEDRELLDQLPPGMLEALQKGQNFFPLDPQKTRFFSYKRNDWETWATPMLTPLLKDLHRLDKMNLADLAALDGAISCIRVWRLGSLEHKIYPGEAALNRLAEMLCDNVGGGVMDLVWGPDIDLLETDTAVHQFLGNAKYEQVMQAIYSGLGIPPTLTGAQSQGGFTNNYISLKTLTERLQYGRDRLVEFWEGELELVQRAMGFQQPAELVFDRMALADEAAIKQLLINLADRDLISTESLQEMFGLTPEIEEVRIRREMKKRAEGKWPDKAGSFHEGRPQLALKKIFSQTGVVTPSEVGVELAEKKPGEESLVEKQATDPPSGQKGQPGQGRPKNSTDKQKRKQKTVQPRTAAFLNECSRAESYLSKISDFVTPLYLKHTGKNNQRQLTNEQTAELENLKFALLCKAQPQLTLTPEWLESALEGPLEIPGPPLQLLQTTLSRHLKKFAKEPILEELRKYQAWVWAIWKGDCDGPLDHAA